MEELNKKADHYMKQFQLESSEEPDEDGKGEMTVKGKKRISGIEMKVSENNKNAQIWPQSVLQLSTCVSALSFTDLDFGTFVAGELHIITQANIAYPQRRRVIELLKCLAYVVPDYEWERL